MCWTFVFRDLEIMPGCVFVSFWVNECMCINRVLFWKQLIKTYRVSIWQKNKNFPVGQSLRLFWQTATNKHELNDDLTSDLQFCMTEDKISGCNGFVSYYLLTSTYTFKSFCSFCFYSLVFWFKKNYSLHDSLNFFNC